MKKKYINAVLYIPYWDWHRAYILTQKVANEFLCCNCSLNTIIWTCVEIWNKYLSMSGFHIINLNKSNKRHVVSLTCVAHCTQKNIKEPIEKTKKIISVINRQLKAPKSSNYYIPVVVINEMCSNEHEQKQVHNKNFFFFLLSSSSYSILFGLDRQHIKPKLNWPRTKEKKKINVFRKQRPLLFVIKLCCV